MPAAAPIVADIVPADIDVAVKNVLVMAVPVPDVLVFSKIWVFISDIIISKQKKERK